MLPTQRESVALHSVAVVLLGGLLGVPPTVIREAPLIMLVSVGGLVVVVLCLALFGRVAQRRNRQLLSATILAHGGVSWSMHDAPATRMYLGLPGIVLPNQVVDLRDPRVSLAGVTVHTVPVPQLAMEVHRHVNGLTIPIRVNVPVPPECLTEAHDLARRLRTLIIAQ